MRGRDDPVLIDFGAARSAVHAPDTNTQVFTANYSSMEQVSGAAQDHRADLYSLAATICHAAFTTKPVGSAQRLQALNAADGDPLEPAALLGRGTFEQLFLEGLDWGLAINASDRPPSARAWREAWAPVVDY